MLKRGSSKSYSIEPIYDPKEFSKPAQPAAENGETSSTRDETSKEGLDYAKLMEPAKMDPEARTQFLGLFIASQPLAQLFFSPVMGFLGNRLGSIRIPAMVSTFIMAIGFAFYASVSALPEPRRWYLFGARFIIGAAGGTTTLCYSYVASASTVKERTTALSALQMTKSFAFIVGPQSDSGRVCDAGRRRRLSDWQHWALLELVHCSSVAVRLLVAGQHFRVDALHLYEFNIAKEEGAYLAARGLQKSLATDAEEMKKLKPDKLALVVCIVISASTQFHFNFIESTATLVVIEQLGITPTRAVVMVGIMYSTAGIYGILMFGSVGLLSRKMGERVVLGAGILFAMSGIISMYPYGGPLSPLKFINETVQEVTTVSFSSMEYSSSDDLPSCYNASLSLSDGAGCPVDKQPWCCETPAIHPEQLIVGYLFIFTGVPLAIMMCSVIFSKVLGPYPQGTWTGLLGAGTAVARILCPLCVTSLYAAWGMLATCAFMTTVMSIVLVIFATSYGRLVPYRHAT
ncbi:Major facilitator superfamily domain-containing protein [Daphnia magna]|uniref:Major facilitator superfamily domain-containing protein n=1 Tax=Daphnia magna TaxID=35525 RepID=A0A164V979_9CRUS|nr:Major facilitator superfamily domain-containing protein [Daphnia magna]